MPSSADAKNTTLWNDDAFERSTAHRLWRMFKTNPNSLQSPGVVDITQLGGREIENVPNAGGSTDRTDGQFQAAGQAALSVPKAEELSVAGEYQNNVHRIQQPGTHVPGELSFHALQEWEGYVVDIYPETFTAHLVDKTAQRTSEEEIVELSISDISEDDRTLLKPGAVFRWSIGYQRTSSGTKRRVSDIVFRRLPQWTKREIDEAQVRARQISASITWE